MKQIVTIRVEQKFEKTCGSNNDTLIGHTLMRQESP